MPALVGSSWSSVNGSTFADFGSPVGHEVAPSVVRLIGNTLRPLPFAMVVGCHPVLEVVSCHSCLRDASSTLYVVTPRFDMLVLRELIERRRRVVVGVVADRLRAGVGGVVWL